MNSQTDFTKISDKVDKLKDALKIAKRALDNKSTNLTKRTRFENMSDSQINEWFHTSSEDIDEMAILYYWTAFERIIIDYLQNKCNVKDQSSIKDFDKKLSEELKEKIEHWRFDDILDLFKHGINSYTIGEAKKVKNFRNFIVHRSKNQPKVTQKQGEQILSSILKKI